MFEYSKIKSELLKSSEKEMMELHHPYVGTEHLLLSLLKKEEIADIAESYHLNYEIFKETLIEIVGKAKKKSEVILYTPLMRNVINKAKDDIYNIFYTLLSSDDGIALRILEIMGIDIEGLASSVCDNNSFDFGEPITSKDILVGREKEINSIIEILLRRNKNNPLLIGEAGVGKSAIVYELSRRIEEDLVPDRLKGYKIIGLDMSNMLSNTKYRGEFETKINNLIKKVKNKKIILFIDEIHTIVKSGGGESSIDAANILKPYLTNRSVTIIGATTTNEYEEFIAKDKALARRFAVVNIMEPDEESTKNILKKIKKVYEDYHGYHISDAIINRIVEYSNLYMKNRCNPDKSIEIMDVLLSRAAINSKESMYLENHDFVSALKTKNVMISDVDEVIESLTGIHILKSKDYSLLKTRLNNYIESHDMNKIIKNKSFILSGKTNLADQVVNIIKDTLKYRLITLDMKEFTTLTSINRLVGSDPGYSNFSEFNILDRIKYQPFTLLYLKNYEYAHPSVKNLFKSINEKHYYSDKKNNIISFNNSLIVMGESNTNNGIGFNNNTCKDNSNFIVNLKEKATVMI